MLQHDGAASVPCVEAGQRVLAGQVIGLADSNDDAVPVHASTSGRVTGIVQVETPHACDVPAVLIEPDGRDEWAPPADAPVEPGDLADLTERISRAGVAGVGPNAPAVADVLAAAGRHGVRHVIINAMESEPYLTAEYRILADHGRLIVRTADLLANLLGAQRLWLALDRANRYLLGELRRLVHGTSVRIAPLRNKYPQGAVPLLVRGLLGREVPYGGSPLDVGAVVLDGCAVLAIAQAVLEGRPCVDRIVTVAGGAADRPGNYRVPIGTPVHRLIEYVGLRRTVRRVVIGGPMRGLAVSSPQVVTTKRVGAVMLLSEDQVVARPRGPCIRCGWCLEDCPVGLDPPSVLAAVETFRTDGAQHEEIAGLFPHACLGCGICSYVCPAGLPLADGLARARTLVSVRS